MPRYANVYAEIAALRAKHGRNKHRAPMPDLSVKRGAPSLSSGFAPVIDNRAKTLADRFKREDARTMDAIKAKSMRIRIPSPKSAYQYMGDERPDKIHSK